MRRRAILALVTAALAASAAVGDSYAKTHPPVPVGTLEQVHGLIRDVTKGAKHAVRVKNGAAVRLGDSLILENGASARVTFTKAVNGKGQQTTLFALIAARALIHQILPGAAKLGPRIAFAYDGKAIAEVAGKGLDAPVHLGKPRTARGRKVRVTFTAPAAQKPTFACSVDHGSYQACKSPDVLHLTPGAHTIHVRTTSLFGFHGSASTVRITVKR